MAALAAGSATKSAPPPAEPRPWVPRPARVLAVAQARLEGSAWPADPAEFAFEWLGLVALADPLRAGVREAVQDAARPASAC